MDLTSRRSDTYTGGSHLFWRYERRSTMRSTTDWGTSTAASDSRYKRDVETIGGGGCTR